MRRQSRTVLRPRSTIERDHVANSILQNASVCACRRPPLIAPVVAVIRPPVEAGLRAQCVVAVVGRIAIAVIPVSIAYVAHALGQREIARRSCEIAYGHRRCWRGHDAAQGSAGDQTDRESFHGHLPTCCCMSRNFDCCVEILSQRALNCYDIDDDRDLIVEAGKISLGTCPIWSGLGVNPMQRFSTWARWIATGILVVVGAIFTQVVFPVAVQQPREAANAFWEFLHVVLKFLRDLSEQPWVR